MYQIFKKYVIGLSFSVLSVFGLNQHWGLCGTQLKKTLFILTNVRLKLAKVKFGLLLATVLFGALYARNLKSTVNATWPLYYSSLIPAYQLLYCSCCPLSSELGLPPSVTAGVFFRVPSVQL